MDPGTLTGCSVLVVDDDVLLRRQIGSKLERMSLDVTGVGTLAEARRLAVDLAYDFVMLDIHLPDGSGLELLREGVFGASAGVVVMTADGGVSSAVEAMRLGAGEYLVKPFDPGELPLVLGRLRRNRQQARIDEQQKSQTRAVFGEFFFGKSLSGLEDMLERILAADVRVREHLPPVLIQGETGTGKTTIARWLHHQGPRSKAPLVEMNCSALPETLAESELFGHERGAFTDARTMRIGLFEAAHGGTLFLDELPSLSMSLQAKVLTALEDHRIRRVGGRREIEVDVRVVAATSRDLKELVAEGQFREDLMHRLDLFRVMLPPLRERGGDLEELSGLLLRRLCSKHRLPERRLAERGVKRLLAHRWPGNVRELSHELERALVFEDREDLELEQLAGAAGNSSDSEPGVDWLVRGYRFPESGFQLEEAIEILIQRALEQSEQNVSAAARLLGVSRDYVRYRLSGRKGGVAGGNAPSGEAIGDEPPNSGGAVSSG